MSATESFLVTGALGCIGAWTCRRLARDGATVIAFDRDTDARRLRDITSSEEFGRVTFAQGDITDLESIERALDDHAITHVIHLAALQVPAMSGVGFYGKLSGASDFVKRLLPADFVESWDRHFQRAVEAGRRELGEHWTSAWREGSAWHFVLPSQLCGSSAWCGVTGPAVDRLGRAFPMVLAAPCSGDFARILANGAWFDALERVYRNAQDCVSSPLYSGAAA